MCKLEAPSLTGPSPVSEAQGQSMRELSRAQSSGLNALRTSAQAKSTATATEASAKTGVHGSRIHHEELHGLRMEILRLA